MSKNSKKAKSSSSRTPRYGEVVDMEIPSHMIEIVSYATQEILDDYHTSLAKVVNRLGVGNNVPSCPHAQITYFINEAFKNADEAVSFRSSMIELQKEIAALKSAFTKNAMMDAATSTDSNSDDVAIQVSTATTDSIVQCTIETVPAQDSILEVDQPMEVSSEVPIETSKKRKLQSPVRKIPRPNPKPTKKSAKKIKQQGIKLVQCFQCQKFGHYASSCPNQPHCVKCGKEHDSRSCSKPKDDPPSCSNCKSGHTANFKGCPFFKKIREAGKRKNQVPDKKLPKPVKNNHPEDITAICKAACQEMLKEFQQQMLLTFKELHK